jgi:putative membrane protein
MLRRMMSVAATALLIGAVTTRAEDRKDQPFDDTSFVKQAANCCLEQVELGKIGAAHAKNEDVKKFAEHMVKDHGKAKEELAAAKAANIAVPDSIDEKHQKHIDTFKNYKGTNFDADFMKHVVTDHTEAVALFTRATKEAKNPQIKDFATKALPTIQSHLEQAKKLSK